MKLAIIGSGRMGSAFATAFATRTSHAVAVRGSHAKSGSAAELVRELGITRADDKALLSADVVFVAVPPAALSEVAADLKDYTGVVVSIIVPGAGGMTLAQQGASAAEQLAELLPKASVVTAFTSISSVLIRTPSSSDKPTVFTCADDENARQTVIGLAEDIGFEGVDAGLLAASGGVEHLGMIVFHLAYGAGLGNRVALRAYVAPAHGS